MPTLDQNFEVYRNANEIIDIGVTDVNDLPVDLTLMDDICWTLSRRSVEVIRYTLLDPELIIANVAGVDDGVRINLPPAATTLLQTSRRLYIHQLWVTLAGNPRPVCIGYVTVKRGDGC